MKVKTHLNPMALAILCIASLAPALGFAGDAAKTSEERGVIKSVDMTAHTLVIAGHKQSADQAFRWNDQTKFTASDKSASASALKAGEQVRLTYTAGKPNPTLQSVNIAPPKAAKPSAKNNSATRSTGA